MQNENEHKAQDKHGYFFTGTEILKMPEDKAPYLLKPYVQRGQISILAGTSDVGKSTFLRQLAIQVSTGADKFLELPLFATCKKAVFYSTEDNMASTKAVLKEQSEALNVDLLDGIYFLFENEKPLDVINSFLKDNKVDLVIIDSFGDAFDGNINDSVAVRRFMKDFSKMATDNDCAVILLHHIGKGKDTGEANKSNLLGSVAIEAKARLVMELKNGKEDNKRELWFTKGNSLSPEQKHKALSIILSENRIFSFDGDIAITAKENDKKTKFDGKEQIIGKIVELKKAGLSYDKIKVELDKLFPENPPSLGTIKNWYKEWEQSQGNENVDAA